MGLTLYQEYTGTKGAVADLTERVHHILSNGVTEDNIFCDVFRNGSWACSCSDNSIQVTEAPGKINWTRHDMYTFSPSRLIYGTKSHRIRRLNHQEICPLKIGYTANVYPQPNFKIIVWIRTKNEHPHPLSQNCFHWSTLTIESVI